MRIKRGKTDSAIKVEPRKTAERAMARKYSAAAKTNLVKTATDPHKIIIAAPITKRAERKSKTERRKADFS